MPLTIIFVRHGESTANVSRIFANRPEIPGDLTPAGKKQAETLARSLDGSGLTHIYTSPLPRALQTAKIIAERFDTPIVTADALREYDVGDDEGYPYSGDHTWRWQRYEQVQRAWRVGDRAACHPGGESLEDIERRLMAFMEKIPTLHDEDDVILAVGHGGVYHMALPTLFPTLPPDIALRYPLGHTDRVVGVLEDETWRCVRWTSVDIERKPM